MYIVHAVPLFLAFMGEQKIIPHYLCKQYGLALVLKINNYWSQLPTLLLQCRSAWLNRKGLGCWSRVIFVLCACGTPFNSLAVLVKQWAKWFVLAPVNLRFLNICHLFHCLQNPLWEQSTKYIIGIFTLTDLQIGTS